MLETEVENGDDEFSGTERVFLPANYFESFDCDHAELLEELRQNRPRKSFDVGGFRLGLMSRIAYLAVKTGVLFLIPLSCW